MTNRNRDLAQRETGAVTAGSSQAAAPAAGGVIYDASGPGGALVLAAGAAAAGSLALLGRVGAAINASAGSADLACARGGEAPAPPPGTTDGAGESTQRTR
jgi:hypothetical protein